MEIKDIMRKAEENPVSKKNVEKVLDCYLRELEEKREEEYARLHYDVYVAAFGEHFCADSACIAVKGMDNADGTHGGHWTVEQTTAVAEQQGVKFEHFNKYDWYYVLNMMRSDYYTMFKDDTASYVRLAKLWLFDVDVREGKAFRYWAKVVK